MCFSPAGRRHSGQWDFYFSSVRECNLQVVSLQLISFSFKLISLGSIGLPFFLGLSQLVGAREYPSYAVGRGISSCYEISFRPFPMFGGFTGFGFMLWLTRSIVSSSVIVLACGWSFFRCFFLYLLCFMFCSSGCYRLWSAVSKSYESWSLCDYGAPQKFSPLNPFFFCIYHDEKTVMDVLSRVFSQSLFAPKSQNLKSQTSGVTGTVHRPDGRYSGTDS